MLEEKTLLTLISHAKGAKEKAYAPYSHFKVGAALLTKSGHIYTGCNIENVSYGATICAERSAVAAAVSAGEREFVAIAVAAGDDITPCGICRQVLAEFNPKLEVICVNKEGYTLYGLDDLLPHAFTKLD